MDFIVIKVFVCYNNNVEICSTYNVCQLAESEMLAVTGGTWQG